MHINARTPHRYSQHTQEHVCVCVHIYTTHASEHFTSLEPTHAGLVLKKHEEQNTLTMPFSPYSPSPPKWENIYLYYIWNFLKQLSLLNRVHGNSSSHLSSYPVSPPPHCGPRPSAFHCLVREREKGPQNQDKGIDFTARSSQRASIIKAVRIFTNPA